MNETLRQIIDLPISWHPLGGFDARTAETIVRICEGRDIAESIETGAGKSTLIFSHLSRHHTVFALDEGESLSMPLRSHLLRKDVVTAVEGPSQLTLPKHQFKPLQLALIDGPHAYPFPELEYYYIYPHLEAGAILIIDDIDIPTINNLYQVLRADRMYRQIELVGKTAFLERTTAPLLDPITGWWKLQDYNHRKRIVDRSPSAYAKRTFDAARKWAPDWLRKAARSLRAPC
jgi:predicted O-methyltransferase YrrM